MSQSRLQLMLDPEHRDVMDRVVKKMAAASYSEAFRRLMLIADRINQREQNGFRFGFVNENNEFEEVWFI